MDIFNISDARKFETEALKIFRHQAKNNKVYKQISGPFKDRSFHK